MANENICVFCGEKLGIFNTSGINCAEVYQPCCKACFKELKYCSQDELCRRALRLGYALQPQKLAARMDLIMNAEAHRPSCLRCGSKLVFEPKQTLDNNPLRDSVFSEGFELLPAYCEICGKYEFYHPNVINKNKFIAYLIEKDTEECAF